MSPCVPVKLANGAIALACYDGDPPSPDSEEMEALRAVCAAAAKLLEEHDDTTR